MFISARAGRVFQRSSFPLARARTCVLPRQTQAPPRPVPLRPKSKPTPRGPASGGGWCESAALWPRQSRGRGARSPAKKSSIERMYICFFFSVCRLVLVVVPIPLFHPLSLCAQGARKAQRHSCKPEVPRVRCYAMHEPPRVTACAAATTVTRLGAGPPPPLPRGGSRGGSAAAAKAFTAEALNTRAKKAWKNESRTQGRGW